jgi:hypothetical protein
MVMAGGAYIVPLDQGVTTYGGYVIYSKAKTTIRLVLINSEYYNGPTSRAKQLFAVNGMRGRRVTARRLTAASALSKQNNGQNPTFGGQAFNNGTYELQGRRRIESIPVAKGTLKVELAATEALINDL